MRHIDMRVGTTCTQAHNVGRYIIYISNYRFRTLRYLPTANAGVHGIMSKNNSQLYQPFVCDRRSEYRFAPQVVRSTLCRLVLLRWFVASSNNTTTHQAQAHTGTKKRKTERKSGALRWEKVEGRGHRGVFFFHTNRSVRAFVVILTDSPALSSSWYFHVTALVSCCFSQWIPVDSVGPGRSSFARREGPLRGPAKRGRERSGKRAVGRVASEPSWVARRAFRRGHNCQQAWTSNSVRERGE